MGNFSFMQLNPTQTTTLLPQMFDILYANMSCIAQQATAARKTGCSGSPIWPANKIKRRSY